MTHTFTEVFHLVACDPCGARVQSLSALQPEASAAMRVDPADPMSVALEVA
jgi:hypothetical protein